MLTYNKSFSGETTYVMYAVTADEMQTIAKSDNEIHHMSRALLPCCCLLWQLPTSCVGAFLQRPRGGAQGV